jgi:hypothetical protein
VGGVGQETLELSTVAQLCANDLAKVSQQALEQDRRAYSLARDVYDGTPPPAKDILTAQAC